MSDLPLTSRLVLIDTVDQLPGLLPLHAYDALRGCDLVVLGRADHPFAAHLQMADERFEVIPSDIGERPVGRQELLSGLSLIDKARAGWVVDRAKQVGALAYIHGPADDDAFTKALGMEAAREALEVEVVYFGLAPKGIRVLDLVGVQERLLAPDGCPWDREQTHASLAQFAVEEAHELAEAIASGDDDHMVEELGDLLMQVVFHAELSSTFDLDAVADGIASKLVRRHPHVFGEVSVDGSDEVLANWETLKAAEKPERTGLFDGIPSGLPPLQAAVKTQSRAGKIGVRWGDADEAAEKVAEELGELLEALEEGSGPGGEELGREIGDLLFAVISLATTAGVAPEDALRRTTARFRARVEALQESLDAEGIDAASLAPDELRTRWVRIRA